MATMAGRDASKDVAVAPKGGIGEYLWCACHNDIKSDMEDVELENLWEDVLTQTGKMGLSMDPFYREDWQEALPDLQMAKSLENAYQSTAGAMSPRSSA